MSLSKESLSKGEAQGESQGHSFVLSGTGLALSRLVVFAACFDRLARSKTTQSNRDAVW